MRRLVMAAAAGAFCGLLVGGIGGRLAMLERAWSTQTTGAISDHGLLIEQLTVSGTLNLLSVCTIIEVRGGGVYLL